MAPPLYGVWSIPVVAALRSRVVPALPAALPAPSWLLAECGRWWDRHEQMNHAGYRAHCGIGTGHRAAE